MSKPFSTWLLALALLAPAAKAQEAVYYFLDKKTDRIGARTRHKIIVPAQYTPILDYELKKPVKDATLEFLGSATADDDRTDILPVWGDAYDRQGRFLYHPMAYDNSADFWVEGLRRFVEKGRVGFVDYAGSKVIPAQWDFATPFEYGYAKVFTGGWRKQCIHPDCEHWQIVPAGVQSRSHLINRQGKVVTGYDTPRHPRDYFHQGKYYPYPFAYNAFEQQLVDRINGLHVLQEIRAVAFETGHPGDYKLHFEITARPSAAFPYYTLNGFDASHHSDSMWTFHADQRGRLFFREHDGRLTPFRQWLLTELHASKKYLREHPDKPFKFDVDARLRAMRRTRAIR